MSEIITAYEERFSEPQFYLTKIYEAIHHAAQNDLGAIGVAVFGFFSGSEYTNGLRVDLDSYHFKIIFKEPLFSIFGARPKVLLKWIEVLFFYFRSMSAIPEIAESVWPWTEKAIEAFRKGHELEAITASCQLASWDFFYGKKNHPRYLHYLKTLPLKEKSSKLVRDLLCGTAINREERDFVDSIKRSYKNRKLLGGSNTAIAMVNYYCHVHQENEVLQELSRYLSGPKMRETIARGYCDFLKPLFGQLYDNNNYTSLFSLVGSFKEIRGAGILQVSHGFLLANGKTIIVLSSSGRDELDVDGSFERYKDLIRQSNLSTNVAISLLGEFGEDTTFIDDARGGTPPINNDLTDYKEAVIKHFDLGNSLYGEFHSLTLAPSHCFPIQSALFSLGKSSPIISVSLEEVADDPVEKKFVFFLSSNTHTFSIEQNYILEEFGVTAEVYIDPNQELFFDILKSESHDVVYISAHGEYDHWGSGNYDTIYFTKEAKIEIDIIKSCRPTRYTNRNIILNICDGAATEISCNPYSRGIASAMAKGNQTIISHLWPVNPIYAAFFGMSALHFIKTHTPIHTAYLTYQLLSQTNAQIIRNTKKLSPSFESPGNFLETKDFNMLEFKNIGSVAVYS